MKRHATFQDDEVYTLAMSASGTNAHHINGCKIVGQSQPYAACLKRIGEYEAGGSLESMPDCKRAIGGPACEAWTMREAEVKADKALFYVNRAKLQAFNGSGAAPAVNVGYIAPPRAPTPPSKPKPLTEALGGSYADAINATMKTLSSPEPVVQSATQPPAMNPGETVLEYVRRMKSTSA